MAMPYASLSPAADHRSSPVLPFCRSSPLSSSVGEEAPMSGRWRPPFTAAQYEELEQQALIYKHLVAGVPVPPDLLLPIHRSIDTLTARYYLHPTIGYGSYFGKKLDPEPGRCRRTDGKKWRCSKEAAPDSKYCERHMHRGRNRSRKPVETQLIPHSQSPATNPPAAAAAAAVPTPVPAATPANGGCFHNHSLYPAISSGGNVSGSFTLLSPQLHMDNGVTAAAGGSKDLRYTAYGVNSLVDERNQLTAGAIDTSIDSSWRLLPSQTSLFALPSYTPLMALNDLGQNTISSLPKVERQPLSFFESDFGTIANSAKQENQTLRPFFDEWPKARDS